MGVEPFKTIARRIRHWVRGESCVHYKVPPNEQFYWHVSHFFHSVFGEGFMSVTMPPDESMMVQVEHERLGVRLRLISQDSHATSLEEFQDNCWKQVGKYSDRQSAILAGMKMTVVAFSQHPEIVKSMQSNHRGDHRVTEDGDRVPRMLQLGDQWTTSLHRSGWGYALEPLGNLNNRNGVIFDGFLESTFCWKDTGQEYLKPWVGVIHNPPGTPKWANGGKATNHYMFKTRRWVNSRKHCKGIFVLSEYHRESLQQKLKVPVSVIKHPTETPERKFSFSEFENNPEPMLVQVGHWLRNPNSLYQLQTTKLTRARLDVGHPWEEKVRQHIRPKSLDLDGVKLIPRVDNKRYDELLSRNVVFLDLVDSSANNAIIECIVRNTPVLVNRIPPVVEYLGEDYPFYFDSLEEASRKADDLALIEKTHRYMAGMCKEAFTQEAFLNSIIQSEVYQSLLRSDLDKFVLLAHARSGSSTLNHILDAHDEIRMSYEPFNPTRGEWQQFEYRSQVTDNASLNRCLEEIYCYYNGIKHLTCQLDHPQNEVLLRRKCRRLFLNRDNLLQTVVSGMIAEQTKKWVGNRNEILKARLEPLNIRKISNQVQLIWKNINRYRDFMTSNGLDFMEVKYEDLYGEDVSIHQKMELVNRIFDYLGAASLSGEARKEILELINPEVSKINTTETYNRIPNIDKVEEKLGSVEYGFLFPTQSRTGNRSLRAAG